jgi:PTS system N-acetylgalactosamine-specific IIA component
MSSTPTGPRAIVAGHGGFAAGLLSAVEQISGLSDRFIPLSNTGLSPAGVDAALREAIDASGARIIFTDLPAGSCTMAARRLAREMPDLVVVTGVALPTLLTFACGADLESAVTRGREALQRIDGPRGA